MSLTSELDKKDSLIKLLLKKHFPNTRTVMKECRERMAGTTTLRPQSDLPWGLIGTTLDYRLRFYYPPKPNGFLDLVARKGAEIACGGQPIPLARTADGASWEVVTLDGVVEVPSRRRVPRPDLPLDSAVNFFLAFERLMAHLVPADRRLSQTDEDHLLRHCWVLALFERFFRDREEYLPNSPLLTPQPKASVKELLALIPDECIEDLRQLSWAFYDRFKPLLSKPTVLNPTFSGSWLVGGADADLIVDGCLVDIKTTISPLKDSAVLHQLLGYVLLDTGDTYHINSVGIYFSRQAFLLDWPLDDLMTKLAGGSLPDLSSLRTELHETYIEERERQHREWQEWMRSKGAIITEVGTS